LQAVAREASWEAQNDKSDRLFDPLQGDYTASRRIWVD